MQYNRKERLLVFQIIVFELVAVSSPYYYENTRSWQLTCQKVVLKSHI